jgi:hypothetical protein
MKIILCLLVFFSLLEKSQAINTVERYWQLEDKMSNDQLFRPLGHDFIFDVNGWGTSGMIGFINEMVDASEVQGTEAQKIAAVTEILEANNDVEHFAYFNLNLGIPLPSFKMGGIGVTPDLRASVDIGTTMNLTNRTEEFELFPSFTLTDYALQLYVKNDFKAGFNLGLELGENWFSNVYLYNLYRWDRSEIVIASEVVQNNKVVDLDKNSNIQNAVASDLTLGWKNEKWKFFGAVEEFRITVLSDKKSSVGDLIYGYDPLARFQGQYTFDLKLLDLVLFGGAHQREGYDIGDGVYAGAEISSEFLPFSGVAMIDPLYFTLHPRFRLWFFQLEYMVKKPLDSRINGFKTAVIHGLNLRLAF